MSRSKQTPRQLVKKTKVGNAPVASKSRQRRKPKKLYSQFIFSDWCKSCGICSAFCPKNVIGRNEAGAPIIERSDDCIGCRFCELHCPDFAITIIERNSAQKARSPS